MKRVGWCRPVWRDSGPGGRHVGLDFTGLGVGVNREPTGKQQDATQCGRKIACHIGRTIADIKLQSANWDVTCEVHEDHDPFEEIVIFVVVVTFVVRALLLPG